MFEKVEELLSQKAEELEVLTEHFPEIGYTKVILTPEWVVSIKNVDLFYSPEDILANWSFGFDIYIPPVSRRERDRDHLAYDMGADVQNAKVYPVIDSYEYNFVTKSAVMKGHWLLIV